MAANDRQVGGDHYMKHPIEPWDYIYALNMNWFQGNIVKYVSRYKDKFGLKDLKKAQHYLEKLIETEYPDAKDGQQDDDSKRSRAVLQGRRSTRKASRHAKNVGAGVGFTNERVRERVRRARSPKRSVA